MNLAKFLSKRTPFYYGWLILGTSGSTQIVRNAAASLTLAVFMYPMAEDLGWSRTVLAGAVSVGGLASTFISPAIGWLIDKYGARTVLTSSIMILGVTTFLTGWATIPIAFYVTYGIGRIIFSSPVQIGSSVVVSRWFIQKRGRANGILTFCHSIGMTGFPLMASILIGIYGWQVAWHLLGVGVWVIAVLPVFLLLAETPESVGLLPDGDKESEVASTEANPTAVIEEINWTLKEALKTPALWQLALAGGLLFVIHSGTNTHMAAFFQDAGLTSNEAAVAVSLNAIFTGLGGLGWGWTIEKIKARYCYAMIAALMSVCSILFSTADTVTEAWIYASLFGTALGGMLVVPSVAMADYFGRSSLGTIRGFTEPFVSFSQAVGALLSGLVFDITGSYNYAFYTLSIVALMAILLTITATVPIHKDNKKG